MDRFNYKVLKYRLQELMDMLPRGVKVGTLCQLLYSEYGITEATFFNHRHILLSEPKVITEADLQKYASFFGIEERELRNYRPEQKQSIFDMLAVRQNLSMKDIMRQAKMSFPTSV